MSEVAMAVSSTERAAGLLQAEKARLERELADLDALDHRLRNAGVVGVPVDDDANDPDAGSELLSREQDEGMRSSLELSLRNNEIARHKLAQGTYSICDRCGGEIPQIRLDELPSALLCRQCAETLNQLGTV